MVSPLVSLLESIGRVEHIPLVPLSVELLLNELNDAFLLVFDAGLLLPKPVKFGLPFSYFLAV